MLDFTPVWWNTPPKKIKHNPRLIDVWRVINFIEDVNNPPPHGYPNTPTVQWKVIYARWPAMYGKSLERAYALHMMQKRVGKPF